MAASRITKFVRVVVAAGCCLVMAAEAVSEPTAMAPSAAVYVVVYSLADLPVYLPGKLQGEFDPSLLIAHIKKSIDPESWNSVAEIGVFASNPSIAVAQTEVNHAQVAELLRSFRRGADCQSK